MSDKKHNPVAIEAQPPQPPVGTQPTVDALSDLDRTIADFVANVKKAKIDIKGSKYELPALDAIAQTAAIDAALISKRIKSGDALSPESKQAFYDARSSLVDTVESAILRKKAKRRWLIRHAKHADDGTLLKLSYGLGTYQGAKWEKDKS